MLSACLLFLVSVVLSVCLFFLVSVQQEQEGRLQS